MSNNNLKLIIIDVDGTMTDAGIYYDENGNELKMFCTRDVAAFFVAAKLGIKIMVLTGRECKATERRMKEMKVEYLFQNVKDKKSFLQDFMSENHLGSNEIGYIGDDLNDLVPMKLVGYKACPADSCKEIKAVCDYVSEVKGGAGAVRDCFENFFCKDNWSEAIEDVYNIGI